MAREPMSQRGYAKHRGVDPKSVRVAIARGRIPVRPDGKIDPDAADLAWVRNTDPTKPRNSVTGNPTHRQAVPGVREPMGSEADGAPAGGRSFEAAALRDSIAQQRLMRESIALRREKNALDREEGRLVDADAIRVLAYTTSRRSRDMVLGLPDRLQDQIPAEVYELLKLECQLICEAIAAPLDVVAATEKK